MCLPFCLGRPAWQRVRRSCGYRVNVFTILASSLLMIRKFYSRPQHSPADGWACARNWHIDIQPGIWATDRSLLPSFHKRDAKKRPLLLRNSLAGSKNVGFDVQDGPCTRYGSHAIPSIPSNQDTVTVLL